MPLYEVRVIKRTGKVGKKLAVIDAASKLQAGTFVRNQKKVDRVKVYPLKLVRATRDRTARTNVIDINPSVRVTHKKRKKRAIAVPIPYDKEPDYTYYDLRNIPRIL